MQSGGSILEMKNEDHSHSACMVDEYFARSRSSKFSIFTQQDSRSKQFLDRLKNNFWGATLTFRHGFYVVVAVSKFSAHNQDKRVIAIVSL